MELKLVKRKCCGCPRTFKVLKDSKTEWCSQDCKIINAGKRIKRNKVSNSSHKKKPRTKNGRSKVS